MNPQCCRAPARSYSYEQSALHHQAQHKRNQNYMATGTLSRRTTAQLGSISQALVASFSPSSASDCGSEPSIAFPSDTAAGMLLSVWAMLQACTLEHQTAAAMERLDLNATC